MEWLTEKVAIAPASGGPTVYQPISGEEKLVWLERSLEKRAMASNVLSLSLSHWCSDSCSQGERQPRSQDPHQYTYGGKDVPSAEKVRWHFLSKARFCLDRCWGRRRVEKRSGDMRLGCRYFTPPPLSAWVQRARHGHGEAAGVDSTVAVTILNCSASLVG